MGKKTIYLSESQVDGIIGLDNSGRGTIPPYAATEVTTGEDNESDDPTIADKVAYSLSTSGLGNRRSGLYCSKNSKKKVFEGGNRDLKDKTYTINDNLYSHLTGLKTQYQDYKDQAGYKTMCNLLDNKSISSNEMYRLKNRLENLGQDTDEFKMMGGDEMLQWINTNLDRDTNLSRKRKEFKSNMGVENAFIKKHSKNNGGKSHTNDNIININYE
jgi:hypothetical protein